MSLGQAIIFQAVILVAVDVGSMNQRVSNAQLQTGLCSDWRETICKTCDTSFDAENRCCWEETAYMQCVDSLLKFNSASGRSSELDSQMMALNKRGKYFLGKRAKYFLGKREGRFAVPIPGEMEEGRTGFYRNQMPEDEKRAKYFLGK